MASDDTSGGKPAGPVVLRIKLRYDTVDAMVQRFAPNVGKSGLFLPTKSLQPVGAEVKFELRIANDTPVLVGLGKVKSVRPPDPANPRAAFGMAIELLRVTREGREVIIRMIERRRAMGLADVAIPMPEDVESAKRADVETQPRAEVSGIVREAMPARASSPVLATQVTRDSDPVLAPPPGESSRPNAVRDGDPVLAPPPGSRSRDSDPIVASPKESSRPNAAPGSRDSDPVLASPAPGSRDSDPVLAPAKRTPGSRDSGPVLTAPRPLSGPIAVARSTERASAPMLGPEPPRAKRPRIADVIARAESGPIAALPGLDEHVDVESALVRARALAGSDVDAELAALRESVAAPLAEITIEAASAELARQLGGAAVRRDRSARWAPPPAVEPASTLTSVPQATPPPHSYKDELEQAGVAIEPAADPSAPAGDATRETSHPARDVEVASDAQAASEEPARSSRASRPSTRSKRGRGVGTRSTRSAADDRPAEAPEQPGVGTRSARSAADDRPAEAPEQPGTDAAADAAIADAAPHAFRRPPTSSSEMDQLAAEAAAAIVLSSQGAVPQTIVRPDEAPPPPPEVTTDPTPLVTPPSPQSALLIDDDADLQSFERALDAAMVHTGERAAAPPSPDAIDDDDDIAELDSMDLEEIPDERTQIGAPGTEYPEPAYATLTAMPTSPGDLADRLDQHLDAAEAEADAEFAEGALHDAAAVVASGLGAGDPYAAQRAPSAHGASRAPTTHGVEPYAAQRAPSADPYAAQRAPSAYDAYTAQRASSAGDAYAHVPGSDPYAMQPPGSDPYGAPHAPSADPYAARAPSSDPYATQAGSDPYAAQRPPSSDPYAAQRLPSSDPYAAQRASSSYATQRPPSSDPYAQRPPSSDPYAAQRPPSSDPYAAQRPPSSDPYAQRPPSSDPYAAQRASSSYATQRPPSSDPYAAQQAGADPYHASGVDPYAAEVGADPYAQGALGSDPYATHRPPSAYEAYTAQRAPSAADPHSAQRAPSAADPYAAQGVPSAHDPVAGYAADPAHAYGAQPYDPAAAAYDPSAYDANAYASHAHPAADQADDFADEEISDLDVLAEADADDDDLLQSHGERETSGRHQAALPEEPTARPSYGDFAARLDLGDDDPPAADPLDELSPALGDLPANASRGHEIAQYDPPSGGYTFADQFPPARTFDDPAGLGTGEDFDEPHRFSPPQDVGTGPVDFDEPHGFIGGDDELDLDGPETSPPIAPPPPARPHREQVPEPSMLRARSRPDADYDLENALAQLDPDLDHLEVRKDEPQRGKPARGLPGMPPERARAEKATVRPTNARPSPKGPRRAVSEDEGVLIDFDDDDD